MLNLICGLSVNQPNCWHIQPHSFQQLQCCLYTVKLNIIISCSDCTELVPAGFHFISQFLQSIQKMADIEQLALNRGCNNSSEVMFSTVPLHAVNVLQFILNKI